MHADDRIYCTCTMTFAQPIQIVGIGPLTSVFHFAKKIHGSSLQYCGREVVALLSLVVLSCTLFDKKQNVKRIKNIFTIQVQNVHCIQHNIKKFYFKKCVGVSLNVLKVLKANKLHTSRVYIRSFNQIFMFHILVLKGIQKKSLNKAVQLKFKT